ncbi:MAG: hypothetical protein ACPGVO_21325 [Spirulinaceae cyanobacterium]
MEAQPGNVPFKTPILRLFTQAIAVPIPSEIIARAQAFAAQVTPTSGTPGKGYQDTQQRNLAKIQHDHFVSKVGEEAAKQVWQRLDLPVTGPDYQVYVGAQKSWAADLVVAGIPLAVKTQTQANAARYGLSWTFQSGTQRRDPILNQPEAWVCFVRFDVPRQACQVYPPYQIRELHFGEPRLSHLRPYKRVVYAAQLPRLDP